MIVYPSVIRPAMQRCLVIRSAQTLGAKADHFFVT
jgi:hypothetical protein